MFKKYSIVLPGILAALTGCVSTQRYKLSQADTAACLADKQALNQNIENLNRQNAELAKNSEEKDTELSKLKGTYDELVDNLKNEISSGQIQVTQLKGKLTLNMVEKILFNSGEATVKDSGKKVLDHIAAALKSIQDKDIRVEGYTDNVPLSPKLRDRFPSNWELSTARATNVVRYLVEKDGLDPSRLVAAGFGEYHPIITNTTEEGRAQNRRIDIVLVPHEVSGNAAYAHTIAASSATTPSDVQTSTPAVHADSPPMVPAP